MQHSLCILSLPATKCKKSRAGSAGSDTIKDGKVSETGTSHSVGDDILLLALFNWFCPNRGGWHQPIPKAGVTVSLISTELTCYFSIGIIHLNRQFDTEFKFYFAMGILNFALRWEWEQIFGRLWLPDKVSGIVEWRI